MCRRQHFHSADRLTQSGLRKGPAEHASSPAKWACWFSFGWGQEDFDCFVVPTVPPLKQQQDTIATLAELARLGVPASRIKLVFNMLENDTELAQSFEPVLAFLAERPVALPNPACRLGANEIYARVRGTGLGLAELARDETDYKGLIGRAKDTADKLVLAQKLATRRLACGVVPELDACFAALGLGSEMASCARPASRRAP